jgi:hypothetical protein
VADASATVFQYRSDIPEGLLQLKIVNVGPQLNVLSARLDWAGLDSGPSTKPVVIGTGQRIDLTAPLGTAECDIDGLNVAPSPPTDDAVVILQLTDGSSATVPVTDPKDDLVDLHRALCSDEMIRTQITMRFENIRVEMIDGRPLSVGDLTLERGAVTGPVRIASTGHTIPFTLNFPSMSEGPILELAEGELSASRSVHFTEGRCDAHAVAETKQPFRFVMQVDLGDGVARGFAVEPDPAEHPGMLATQASGCEALGATGGLEPRVT